MHPITFGNPVAITKMKKIGFFIFHSIEFDLVYFEPFSAYGCADIDISCAAVLAISIKS